MQLVQQLLEIGAGTAINSEEGSSALGIAAAGGHEAVVQLLLEEGADVQAKAYGGETALRWTAGNGYGAVVQLLQLTT